MESDQLRPLQASRVVGPSNSLSSSLSKEVEQELGDTQAKERVGVAGGNGADRVTWREVILRPCHW